MSTSTKSKRNGKARSADGHEVARKLRLLTNGQIKLDFSPTSRIEDDPGSQGHLYHGSFNDEHEELFVGLDDRKPDMEQQLIDELARVGRLYFKLAADTAAKCRKRAPTVTPDEVATDGGGSNLCWGYIGHEKVMSWLADKNPDLTFTPGEQYSTVRVAETPETVMLVRNCEPIRMQVVKELRRVADFLTFLAGSVEDTDYCSQEIENDDRDALMLEWLAAGKVGAE